MNKSACLLLVLLQAVALAEESPASDFRISGFGTLNLSRHDSEHATLRTAAQQANGVSDKWSFKNDTVLGVQTRYRPRENLDFTLQLLSRHNHKNNFDPQVDWAYVAWRATPALSLRAGRFITPMLMASDYRNVNYSNPWIRPPLEVYGLLTLNNVDGIDAIYKGVMGGMSYVVQPFMGKFELHINNNGIVNYHRMAGINFTLQGEETLFRVAYMDSTHSLENQFGVFNVNRSQINAPGCGGGPPGPPMPGVPVIPGPGCEVVYPGYTEVANRLDVDRKRFDVFTVGGSYDNGSLLLQAEYVKRMTGSQVASADAWYVGAGYRFGNFLPYAIVSRHKSDTDQYILAPAPAFSSRPPLVLRNSSTDQSSVSLGLRYDLRKNVALKFQYDWLKPEPGRYGGTFGNGNLFPIVPPPQGKFLSEYGTVHVAAFSVDFVF
ncbi:porin [Chitinimonas lacunae]|uniref:Porin n=1 Tax=Chitinimonas lacunae TaxID=1963018 RepID=A0ABV8MQ71_9NEIS